MIFELGDCVALVTGASRGIGYAVASALLESGATVVSVSRSGSDVGLSMRADITRADEIERIKVEVERSLGAPTILVNAAGTYGPIQHVKDSDHASWVNTLMVNTVAPYLTCRAFAGGMIDARWGRIINITSAASLHSPGPLNSAYGTSKVALNQFTRHLASELAGTGVTANVLHPGDIKTAMWTEIGEQLDHFGSEADDYRNWVDWVERTGGDPVGKAADAVLSIVRGATSGRFHWIEDPLQAPLPTWPDTTDGLAWASGSGR